MSPKTSLVFLFLWSSAIGLSAVIYAAPPSPDDSQAGTPNVEQSAEQRSDVATTHSPRVQPGQVRWHDNFEAACTASKQSGKPVLLFQLLGRLDAADT